MEVIYKEVYFDGYCEKCKFRDNYEDETPCDVCLAEPAREYSHKPVYYEPKQKGDK